jgi:4'-phosphopantetheinyl transferase
MSDAGTDVWYVPLEGDSRSVARYEGSLSDEERKRAGEFRFERDALRYLIAHGALRAILAEYAGVGARHLEFSVSPAGKPSLAVPGAGIHFNLTHSGDLALLAVSRGGDVGVDVEKIVAGEDLPLIARRCFCRAELAHLEAAPPALYAEEFYTLWTRKEAYVKGKGDGLSAELTGIDVSASPSRPGGDWLVRDVDVPPEYRGAIATRSPGDESRMTTIHYHNRERHVI